MKGLLKKAQGCKGCKHQGSQPACSKGVMCSDYYPQGYTPQATSNHKAQ